MPIRNAICIAVDGLRASALGAYGNTWHPTPALDALASQSQVFDWMWSDSPTLEGFYRSTWAKSEQTLAERLGATGLETALVTDERSIAERGEAAGFSDVRCFEIRSQQSAASIADTELAQLFAVAIDHLESWQTMGERAANSSPRLLWLHARGFHGSWDAPLELRESLLDDDDPPAPTFLTPPANVAVDDHDELLLYRAAYAAQAMVLDECIGALVAALAEFGRDRDTMIILVGCRGFALGEHGAVGGEVRMLYSELLHIPCLVRMPGTVSPPPRSSQLILPVDLHTTLIDWFGAPAETRPSNAFSLLSPDAASDQLSRQFVIARTDNGERAIRTPAWMLREAPLVTSESFEPPPAAVELYAKPDDRWEANEVADRLPDVVARLLAVLDRAIAADGDVRPADSEPLDADLLTPAR